MKDPRLRLSRHIVFNLTQPENSLILLAPLAEKEGGYNLCRSNSTASAIFADRQDPGYRALLDMVTAGKDNLNQIKRFDMPGFQPRNAYIREMKRYGVIPDKQPSDTEFDPYKIDDKYWKSLWYTPQK